MTKMNNHLDGSNIYPLPGQQEHYAKKDYESNNFHRLEGGIASLFRDIMGINFGRGMVPLIIALHLVKAFHGRLPAQTDVLIARATQYDASGLVEPASLDILMCPKGLKWGTSGDTITGNMVASYTNALQEAVETQGIPNIPSFTLAFEEITDICPELLSSDKTPIVCGDEKDYEDSTYLKHSIEYYRYSILIKLRLLWIASVDIKVMTCHGTLAQDALCLVNTPIAGLPRVLPTAQSTSALVNATTIGLPSMIILNPLHPAAIYRRLSTVLNHDLKRSKINEFSTYNRSAPPDFDDGLTELALIHLIWRHAVVNFARIAWFDGFERLGNPFFEILKRDHPILAGGAAGREMTFSDILANHAVVNVSYDVGFKDQLFIHPITIRSKVNPKNARKYDTLDELRRMPVFRAVMMQSPELIETERHSKYQSTSVAFHPSEDELVLLNNTIAEINARWNNDWLVGLALSTINGYLRNENYHIDTKNVGIFMEDKHIEFGGKMHDRVSVMFLKLGDTGHNVDSLCELLEGGKDVKNRVS